MKNINWNTVQLDGVDSSDYPKFCDAYISYAEYEDGTELTDDELSTLSEENGDYIQQTASEDMMSNAYDRAKDIRKYGP